MRVKDRLKRLMDEHDIIHVDMATILKTPYGTFQKWMRENDTQPPACMILLLDILEQSAEARKIAGVEE